MVRCRDEELLIWCDFRNVRKILFSPDSQVPVEEDQPGGRRGGVYQGLMG